MCPPLSSSPAAITCIFPLNKNLTHDYNDNDDFHNDAVNAPRLVPKCKVIN